MEPRIAIRLHGVPHSFRMSLPLEAIVSTGDDIRRETLGSFELFAMTFVAAFVAFSTFLA